MSDDARMKMLELNSWCDIVVWLYTNHPSTIQSDNWMIHVYEDIMGLKLSLIHI